MLKFIPTGPRVVLRPKLEKETKSGIVLAYDERRASADSDTGEVLALGPQAYVDFGDGTPWVKPGQTVYYSKYGAKVLKDGEDFYIICNDVDILAIVNEDNSMESIEDERL